MGTTNNKAAPLRGTASTPRANYKRFPAYGKQLMEQRLAGQVPRNGVYVVFDWKLAGAFPRIVLADNVPFDNLELRYLAGLDLTIAYRSAHASLVPALAREVLKVNPRILNEFAIDLPQNFILKNIAGEVTL